VEQITTLALDRLSNAPPGFSLPALQLLLSCIYAGLTILNYLNFPSATL